MSNLTETTSDVMDVIGEKITAMADSLQVPAEKLLEIGIGGMQAEATVAYWTMIILGIFILIFTFCMVVVARADDLQGAAFFMLPIFLLMVWFCVSFQSYVVKSNAPEYAIILKIMPSNSCK